MADQGELMGIFSNLITDKQPVTLYNTYRGLPFNHAADILRVEHGHVTTRVHRHQAVSMVMEGRTHLHSSILPEIIRAKVVNVDFRKKQATLSEFTGVGDAVGKRTKVRVQPSEPMEAEISDGRRRIMGRIADTSPNGMCIFTYIADMYGLSFRSGWEVYIDFTPPGMDTKVRFLGVIANINYHDESYMHRVGLKIFPNPEIQSVLEEYVAKQQQLILREMELTYHSLCEENTSQG